MRFILDEWMVVPVGERTGCGTNVMSVNESGHALWELLINGADEETLVNRILQEYDTDAETAAGDIMKFVSALLENGVAEIAQ